MFELDLVRVTEKAALAAAAWTGRGERNAADQAAVDAMRAALHGLPMRGTVVIGEGERDEAPMLYIGEKLGQGWMLDQGPNVHIAVDPLEGTNLCATASPGALAVLAVAIEGWLLHAPDTYMKKMAVSAVAKQAVRLEQSPAWNVHAVAEAKRMSVRDITAIVLDRPRHQPIIQEIRQTGARVQLISDGDVAAALLAADPGSGVDILLGTGGAPEGVLAAVALQCLGGGFQGQLAYRNEEEKNRAEKMGIHQHDFIYSDKELARGQMVFSATGVTPGPLVGGVRVEREKINLESLLLGSMFPGEQKRICSIWPNR